MMKDTNQEFNLIYKDSLLRIKEVPFYPGSLKIYFNHPSNKVLCEIMFYFMSHLQRLVPFKAFYMTVARNSPTRAKVALFPWTEGIIERFKNPSQYSYPCKIELFTKKLCDLCVQIFNNLPIPLAEMIKSANPADFCEQPSYPDISFEEVLQNHALRAEMENTPHFESIKAKGFTLEDVLKNILPPIIIKNYFISIDKSKNKNKTYEEIIYDIQEIFTLRSQIKSNSKKYKKKQNLSIIK